MINNNFKADYFTSALELKSGVFNNYGDSKKKDLNLLKNG